MLTDPVSCFHFISMLCFGMISTPLMFLGINLIIQQYDNFLAGYNELYNIFAWRMQKANGITSKRKIGKNDLKSSSDYV